MRAKTRVILALLGLLVFASCATLFISLFREPHFSDGQCDSIHVGMSRTQVEHILGKPPKVSDRVRRLCWRGSGFKTGLTEWLSRDGSIAIYFDDEDRVRQPWLTIEPAEKSPARYYVTDEKPSTLDPVLDFFDDVVDWFRKLLP